jgi:hypothetical protein
MEDFESNNAQLDFDCVYSDVMPVASTRHGDTLASATKKVLLQLEENKAYLEGKTTEKLERRAVYKEVRGEYHVGARYANRYFHAFNNGKNKFAKVKSKEACVAMLGHAIANVKAGLCNAALQAAIDANIAMHQKRKAKA